MLSWVKNTIKKYLLCKKNPTLKILPNVTVGKGLCFGKYVTLYSGVYVNKVCIGDMTYVAQRSRLFNCAVGKYCSIGPDARIGLGIHPTTYLSTHPAFYCKIKKAGMSFVKKDKFVQSKRVVIGNDVWVGSNVIVYDGINIGNGSIIAANSVVNVDVPPYAICGGVPCKIIKFRFEKNIISTLENLKWWDLSFDQLRIKADLFINKNDDLNEDEIIKNFTE